MNYHRFMVSSLIAFSMAPSSAFALQAAGYPDSDIAALYPFEVGQESVNVDSEAQSPRETSISERVVAVRPGVPVEADVVGKMRDGKASQTFRNLVRV